jgi:hypothetical protein
MVALPRGRPSTIHRIHLVHPLKAKHDAVVALQPSVHTSGLQAQVILTLYSVTLLAEPDVGSHLHVQVVVVKVGARYNVPGACEVHDLFLLSLVSIDSMWRHLLSAGP